MIDEKEKETEFFKGAIWAASLALRMHHDTVLVKDMLNEFDAESAARSSAEYDVQPLRELADGTLPLGIDADYKVIGVGLQNDLGEFLCHITEATDALEEESNGYCIYALTSDDRRIVLVPNLYSEENAEEIKENLRSQLVAIKAASPTA